jgi:hypothetical protein
VKYAEFPKVTRITVVTKNGLEHENYNAFFDGAEVHLQDGGRTLKVFPRSDLAVEGPADPPTP